MDASNDELRRELHEAGREHEAASARLGALSSRRLDETTTSLRERAELLVGHLDRRRFLQLGGLSAAGAAILAACNGSPGATGPIPVNGTGPTTTSSPARVTDDVTYLRTASSVEHSLIAAYEEILGLGVLTGDVADGAKTFRDQHAEHAGRFADLTQNNGGQVMTGPNAALDTLFIAPAFSLAEKDGNKQADLLAIAYAIEELAAETYQEFTPLLSVPDLRRPLMAVGGVESRHAAVLAKLQPSFLLVPAEQTPATATTTTVAGGTTTTTSAGQETPELAPVFVVPGAFQPLTSVEVTIGITTLNADPLGPNSYAYPPATS